MIIIMKIESRKVKGIILSHMTFANSDSVFTDGFNKYSHVPSYI